MHVFLLLLIFLTHAGDLHVQGVPFHDAASCEVAKAQATKEALQAGITELSVQCVDAPLGTAS